MSVFISYAHEDERKARVLATALEEAGFDVWWDPAIRIGSTSFQRAIEKALRDATCVIVLWSAASVDSEYVEIEASYGRQAKKLVPVLIEDVGHRIPVAFHLVPAQDLTDWSGDRADSRFSRLEQEVRERLNAAPGSIARRAADAAAAIAQSARSLRNRLDRLDAVALIAVGFATAAAWSLFGRNGPTAAERWMWAALPLLVTAGWFVMRSTIRPHWSRAGRSRTVRAIPIGVVALGFAAWGATVRAFYAIDAFAPDTSGVFVARLHGDDADRFQIALVDSLEERIQRLGLGNLSIEVRRLPRRVHTDDEAIGLARSNGAVLVIRGSVDSPPGSSATVLTGRLTTVDLAGFHSTGVPARTTVGMAAGLRGIGLQNELSALQSALPAFMAEFAVYQDGRYDRVGSYLELVTRTLPHTGTSGEGHTLSEALLASAWFYAGNAHVLLGQTEQAKTAYETSIRHSRHDPENRAQFIHPLSNLAVLLTNAGALDSAAVLLTQAVEQCGEATSSADVCAPVAYNLGTVLVEMNRMEEARGRFEEAISAADSTSGNGSSTRRLLAYSWKNLAFVDAALALAIDDQSRRIALYRQAMEEWTRSGAHARATGDEAVPSPFLITRARIEIGLGDWTAAGSALDTAADALGGDDGARAPGENRPLLAEIDLLRAAVHACTGDLAKSATFLTRYTLSAGANTARGMATYDAMIHRCGARK